MSTPEITPYESGRGIVDSWLDLASVVKLAEDLPAFLPQMGLGEDLTVPFEADKFVSYLRDLSASSVERQRDLEQLFQHELVAPVGGGKSFFPPSDARSIAGLDQLLQLDITDPFDALGFGDVDLKLLPQTEIVGLRLGPERLSVTQEATERPATTANGTVDRDRLSVFIDGEWHDLTLSHLDIIKKLTAKRGAWIGGPKLKSDPNAGERPDKLISGMPDAVRKHIESHRAKGYRWIG